MTNPSPDTGAGTPLRWYSPCGYSVVGLFAAAAPIPTCPECYGMAWATFPPPFAARPATDPAGLDVKARIEGLRPWPEGKHLIEALLRLHETTYGRGDGPGPDAAVLVEDQERPLIWVEGPGPEDEWFGQSLGVPDPRLERRSR